MKKTLMGLMAVVIGAGTALADGARDQAEIIAPGRWKAVHDNWHYAPALQLDGRIYVSGVAVIPENGDYDAACRAAWQRIEGLLQAAGASLDDVVEIVSYHTALKGQLTAFGAVKDEFIRTPYPAWSAIGVSELASQGAVAEIRVVAHHAGVNKVAH